ncbi:hypothetical protein TTHERM_00395720 (macronuclear) [Tetrahymena thermophila SB210]|uniref:Uncharacterized protein n=1 Tax=Tetrahymena thermophila (strain SB210) TaxID=312017 RepID=Q232Y1_TETTS|nr:hypothetical protein TTHERM_00395720 [Tetrahymena thermophila SB210]EAR91699.1 hypothetical protein TTHERM_00395720 [Tetrahymena thermophila SB210]|eukprot:XP_001011944.1 hypothetical protein TTHERM_00395720 [Tetrahymena thermophila SB210]
MSTFSNMDTSFLYEKKEEIRTFIQKLLSDKGKDTNYVNKRMQDSIVNFFLEDYVAPLFIQSTYFCSSLNRKQFHKNIVNNLKQKSNSNLDAPSSHKNPKYVQLLSEYLELLNKENLVPQYQQMLVKTIMMDESDNKENCLTLLWRKQLCILLLEHLMNPQLNNIYLMWNSAYPENPIYNKKESFYRKNLKQKKIMNTSSSTNSNQSMSNIRAIVKSINQKEKGSFDEESQCSLSTIKQEYIPLYQMEQQEQSFVSQSFSSDLRSPKLGSMTSSEQSFQCKVKPLKEQQKRAKILYLSDLNKKSISYNLEILQFINQQLSNQTYLSSSIIQLQ